MSSLCPGVHSADQGLGRCPERLQWIQGRRVEPGRRVGAREEEPGSRVEPGQYEEQGAGALSSHSSTLLSLPHLTLAPPWPGPHPSVS